MALNTKRKKFRIFNRPTVVVRLSNICETRKPITYTYQKIRSNNNLSHLLQNIVSSSAQE